MSRASVLHGKRLRPLVSADEPAQQELGAVREIVHAFLTADQPAEVFQFAMDRVLPLVGAAFASVYLVDGASELMRLAAASNWPERYQPWLSEMRVRVGFGPSGEAVSERRPIEIPDILDDPALEDWAEVAQELGFRALVAHPLLIGRQVLGAATFYFAEPGTPTAERRALLRMIAEQLAATAEKAALTVELSRAKAALADANEELEQQYVAVHEAKRVKEEFLANISHELRRPLTAVLGYLAILEDEVSGPLTGEQRSDLAQVRISSERLVTLVDNLIALNALKRGTLPVHTGEFDAREPLHDAIAGTPGRATDVMLRVNEPDDASLAMRSDRGKLTRILGELLGNAYKFTRRGEVTLSVSTADGRSRYVVQDTGIGIPADAQAMVFDEFRQADGSATRRYGGSGLGLALARRLARLLGGDIVLESVEGAGTTFTLELPLDYEEPRRARVLAAAP